MIEAAAHRAWTWQHAVAHSGLPATTKAVLYALSLFMSPAGTECFPKIEKTENDRSGRLDLVTATGLSKRAVIEHLKAAEDAGWLVRRQVGFTGQRWRRLEYEARWPERDLVAGEMEADEETRSGEPGSQKGGDGRSPPSEKVVTLAHEGGDPDDTKVVTDDHQDKDQSTDLSSDQSRTERERRARDGQEARPEAIPDPSRPMTPEHRSLYRRLRALAERYPLTIRDPIDGKAWPIWFAMPEDARQRAESPRLEAFVVGLKGPKGGMPRRPPLQEYLGEQKFDLVEAPEEGAARSLETLRRGQVQRASRPWWALWWETLRLAGADPRLWVVLARETTKAETTSLPWTIEPERRDAIEAAGARLVQVARDGAQAMAWAEWCRGVGPDRFGVHFPQFDVAPFIWVPSEWPPDAAERAFSEDDGVEL